MPESITCSSFSEEYFCLCFETKIWIIKIKGLEKIKTIAISGKPSSSIYFLNKFLISYTLKYDYGSKTIEINQNFKDKDRNTHKLTIHQKKQPKSFLSIEKNL